MWKTGFLGHFSITVSWCRDAPSSLAVWQQLLSAAYQHAKKLHGRDAVPALICDYALISRWTSQFKYYDPNPWGVIPGKSLTIEVSISEIQLPDGKQSLQQPWTLVMALEKTFPPCKLVCPGQNAEFEMPLPSLMREGVSDWGLVQLLACLYNLFCEHECSGSFCWVSI
jgi:hypothetical protein